MTDKANNPESGRAEPIIEFSEGEKEGAIYIGGIFLLIALIVILASLTHVVLHP